MDIYILLYCTTITQLCTFLSVIERIADNVIIVTANEKLFNSSDIIVHEHYDGISNNNIALIKIIFKDKEKFEHISVTLENLKELDTIHSFIGVPLIACGFGEVVDTRFIPELLICKDVVVTECPIYSTNTICTENFDKMTSTSINSIFLFIHSIKFNKMIGISKPSGSTNNKYLAFSQISSHIKWINKKAI